MTAFEAPFATEVPNSIRAKSMRRRTMVAIMAFLATIAAIALVPANSHSSFPGRSVLACGDAPGLCPSPPGSQPHSSAHTWF